MSEILGSHDNDCRDLFLPGSDTVKFNGGFGVKYCIYFVWFALNMEAEYWSETSLHCYQPASLYSPEYANKHQIITEFAFFFCYRLQSWKTL
jgi:hypothetical protein